MQDAEHNRAVTLKEGIAIGEKNKAEDIAKEIKNKALETAWKLLERGFSAKDIADISGLSISEIQEMARR